MAANKRRRCCPCKSWSFFSGRSPLDFIKVQLKSQLFFVFEMNFRDLKCHFSKWAAFALLYRNGQFGRWNQFKDPPGFANNSQTVECHGSQGFARHSALRTAQSSLVRIHRHATTRQSRAACLRYDNTRSNIVTHYLLLSNFSILWFVIVVYKCPCATGGFFCDESSQVRINCCREVPDSKTQNGPPELSCTLATRPNCCKTLRLPLL